MMFAIVKDLNVAGAKSEMLKFDSDGLVEEIEDCYNPIGDAEGCPPSYHERISGQCIPYIDYDGFEDESKRIASIEKLENAIEQVFPGSIVLIADRSGFSQKHDKYKMSLRAYIRGAGYFSSPQACGEFMVAKFRPLIGDIDGNAYKKNQNMGLLFNTKMGDPRILQPLDENRDRIAWDVDRGSLLISSIIQDIDGETVCLDPEGFSEKQATAAVASISLEGSPTIEAVVNACLNLMPGLVVREIKEAENTTLIEFFKNNEECPICKRIHKGNRNWAVFYPRTNRAEFRCHDEEAKDKKIDITMPKREIAQELQENTPELKLLRGDHTDDDYMEYVVSKYPGTFVMTPFRMYQFTEKHIWESTDLGEKKLLFNFLGETVYKDLRRVLDSTYSDISDAKEHADIAKKLLRLRSTAGKKQIIEAIESKIKIDDDPFDKNPNLFGFTNGIYDLEAGIFRDGRREDMVSQFADYAYEKPNQAKKAEVMQFITQIMPREDEREFLLRAMASGLYNKTVQNFFVLTGSGGNGKDALVGKLYKDTLGKRHFETSTTTNLTEKRKGELSQSIANMHRKRVVIWQEPGKHSALQSATIKEITGGEYISARGIYQKSTDVEIHASCFMLCNDIPKLDSVDGGIQRRMLVIPFRSLFRSKEEIAKMINPENVYEVDNKYNEADYRNASRTTLFHILLDHYDKFKKDGHLIKDVPQSIQDQSSSYIQDSDEFLTWFNDQYEKTEDRTAVIQAKTVYADYKNSDLYLNLSKAAKRTTTLKSTISEIEKRPELRINYMERYAPTIDGKRKEFRNALIGYKIKEDQAESDEE